MKLFYTGPAVNAEMLVVMLEKHGIAATQEFDDPNLPDDGDLNRLAKVLVPEADENERRGRDLDLRVAQKLRGVVRHKFRFARRPA